MAKVLQIELKLNVPKIINLDFSKIGPPGASGDNTNRVYINPSVFLATYDVLLPATPEDKKKVIIHVGGTIAPGELVVDALTVSPNAGQSIYQAITPVQAFGGDVMIYEYEAATTLWRRIQ
jgi:hypothetical protein